MSLCGLFVGGRASRMGGIAKGLLPAPGSGEPLVLRLARLAHEQGCEPVLVGAATCYREALPALRTLQDAPAGIGPLGGLGALLKAAGGGPVLALACDLPRVSGELLGRLLREAPRAAVLAPRREGFWQPLVARYRADLVLPVLNQALAAQVRSFHGLYERLSVVELTLDADERENLVDWDTPEDVRRGAEG